MSLSQHVTRLWPIFLGVMVVVGAGTWLVFQRGTMPADLVPAETTIALIQEASQPSLKALQTLIPDVTTPAMPEGAHIAILQDAQGLGWVLFGKEPIEGAVRYGRFYVQASSPQLLQSLSGVTPRLRDQPAFARLMPPHLGTWLYVDSRGSGLNRSLLLSFQAEDRAVSFETGESTTLVGRTLPTYVPELSPAPSVILTGSEPQRLWDQLLASSGNDQRLLLQTIAQQWIRTLLDDEVSMAYDVLPLLEEPSVLAVRRGNGSGETLRFVIAGSSANAMEMRDTLKRFQDGARKTLSSAVIEERSFDRGFASTLVRRDEGALREWEDDTGGWAVQGIEEAHTGRGLFGATNGNDFILSNDVAWLRQMINPTSLLDLPDGGFLAGMGERPLLESFLQDVTISPVPLEIFRALDPPQLLRLSARIANGRLTIRMTPL